MNNAYSSYYGKMKKQNHERVNQESIEVDTSLQGARFKKLTLTFSTAGNSRSWSLFCGVGIRSLAFELHRSSSHCHLILPGLPITGYQLRIKRGWVVESVVELDFLRIMKLLQSFYHISNLVSQFHHAVVQIRSMTDIIWWVSVRKTSRKAGILSTVNDVMLIA